MFRHINYPQAVRRLANMARNKASDRDALFHGSRYGQLILRTGVLLRAEYGEKKVCLTRSAEVAAYWALLERDNDEGRGAILIFDRRSLERRYGIEANPEVYWHTEAIFHDECEEVIWGDVIDIRNHLIGYVSGPTSRRSQKTKTPYRKYITQIEARLLLEQRLIRAGKSEEFRSSIPLRLDLEK